MDSTLSPLPEAFLRHRTSPGHNIVPGDGGLKENSSSAGTGSSGGSQWSLRGMWPAGKPQGPAGNGEGRRPTGGMVGPFGNGAGAAATGQNLPPTNSRLFGGSAAGVGGRSAGQSKDSLFDSWRAQGGAGLGEKDGSRIPEKSSRDSHSGGGGEVGAPKGSAHWMPDFSRGSTGLASSAEPAGGRFSGETRASAGVPSASNVSRGYSSGSSLAAVPAYLSKQPNVPAARRVAAAEGERRNGGDSVGEMVSDSTLTSFGAAATFRHGSAYQPASAGPFSTAVTMEDVGGGIEEDDGVDDENPFA